MKKTYLFPYRSKKVSGVVFFLTLFIVLTVILFDLDLIEIPSKVFAVAVDYGVFGKNNGWLMWTEDSITDEILFIPLISSGLIYAFSKEKVEDEMVSKIRLDSLVWATYFNYTLIILSYVFFYGFVFFDVMMIALFSHLLFFIIRFRWMMFKQNKLATDEE